MGNQIGRETSQVMLILLSRVHYDIMYIYNQSCEVFEHICLAFNSVKIVITLK